MSDRSSKTASKNRFKLFGDSDQPWYGEGLRFSCTGCGGCCTGAPGYVWVTDEEVQQMAAHLKLTIDDFAKRYLRRVGKRLSLREDPHTFDCVFLDGKRCSLYDVRPVQCRTYPWWPQNMRDAESWQGAAGGCEGINDNAPIVPAAEMERQLQDYCDAHGC